MFFVKNIIFLIIIHQSACASYSYSEAGCFDVTSFAPLAGGGSIDTVDACAIKCRQSSKPYAAVQAGSSCFCADEFGLGNSRQDCNFTCSDKFSCGGVDSINQFSAIDNSVIGSRDFVVHPEGSSFKDARATCSKFNGDLVAQMGLTGIKNLVDLIQNNNKTASISQVWIGLRKRKGANYEWVSEIDKIGYYTAEAPVYSWAAGDSGLACVTLLIGPNVLKSADCGTSLPFACFQTNSVDQDQSTASPVDDSNNKNLALFIILPLFLFCYCGASIIYCVHQILKYCCYPKKPKKKEGQKSPRPPSTHGRLLSAKRTAVYPGEIKKTPPAYEPSAEPPMTKRDITLSIFEGGKQAPTYQAGNLWPTLKEPAEYQDERKAKLLENAAKEARERREKEDETPFAGLPRKPTPVAKPPSPEEDRPESARSTTKLISGKNRVSPSPAPITEEPPAQNLAGMSINDILRQKMAQQKKPPKIINN